MPYRIDITDPPGDAFDRLVSLGALDVEPAAGSLAAVMPDGIAVETVARALGITDRARVALSPAVGRDDDSVWILAPRHVHVGRLLIAPETSAARPDTLRLVDAPAFGTGLHPTTALCLEALEERVTESVPATLLDVGTGSGVLALAALRQGVPRAVGLDVDAAALDVAAANARLNGLEPRLRLVGGGPDAVDGSWPLVLANVLAAPLVEMAPLLVRRVGHGGRLVLSGIPDSVAPDVEQAYRRLGMRAVDRRRRGGWSAVILDASW